MRDTAIEVIGKCDACQKSRAMFPSKQRQLHPTYKGVRPFQQWSVDSIPNFAGSGITLIVCVDPFSKWVEVLQVERKDSRLVW